VFAELSKLLITYCSSKHSSNDIQLNGQYLVLLMEMNEYEI